MKTLISLERYVAQRQFPQTNLEAESESLLIHNFYNDVIDYATALKQQPQLNHFIPCIEKDGGVWGILNKEERYSEIFKESQVYQSASKNVLFDRWEVKGTPESPFKISNGFVEIEFWYYSNGNLEILATDYSIEKPKREKIKLYSDLTKYNLPLTDNGQEYFNIKN